MDTAEIRQMRSPEEMLEYCYSNKLGSGIKKSGDMKNFGLIVSMLQPDEYAFMTFVGIHRFKSMSSHQRNYAYAFTNKRLLMAKVMLLNRTAHEEYNLDRIMNLSFDSDRQIGIMKVMLDTGSFNVAMSSENMQHMQDKCSEMLPVITGFAKSLE